MKIHLLKEEKMQILKKPKQNPDKWKQNPTKIICWLK